jgi:hypothetical protein
VDAPYPAAPLRREHVGLLVVDRDVLIASLLEPNGFAVEQIDRRNDLHGTLFAGSR